MITRLHRTPFPNRYNPKIIAFFFFLWVFFEVCYMNEIFDFGMWVRNIFSFFVVLYKTHLVDMEIQIFWKNKK